MDKLRKYRSIVQQKAFQVGTVHIQGTRTLVCQGTKVYPYLPSVPEARLIRMSVADEPHVSCARYGKSGGIVHVSSLDWR